MEFFGIMQEGWIEEELENQLGNCLGQFELLVEFPVFADLVSGARDGLRNEASFGLVICYSQGLMDRV